ncbi:unnamed protein product [Taenia asiatica]|uniref:Histone H2A n=1 Tax=Taenia asiatica TaxID=60517 RepID=A0A0R3WH71_TAEAS|nr:unnamed protein product [Taenia asiatica]
MEASHGQMRRGCRYGEVYSFPLFVCTDCCAVATTRSVWMLECRSTGLLCSLEYLAVEVVDLPSNATRDSEKTHIIPRYVHLVIPNDEKLNNHLVMMVPGYTIVPEGFDTTMEQWNR